MLKNESIKKIQERIKGYISKGLVFQTNNESARKFNDDSIAVKNAKALCETVVACGDRSLLERDFTTEFFLSKADCISKSRTEQILKSLLGDILRYLKLPMVSELKVNYINDDINKKTEQAGQYASNSFYRAITINIRGAYGPSNIVAILCHECAHYYMEIHKLNVSDTALNEIRTDIMANLLGFSRIMIEGYKEVHCSKTEGNITITSTHKVGYITDVQCREVREYLLFYREQLWEKDNEIRNNAETKRKTALYLETAELLNKQLMQKLEEARETEYRADSFRVLQVQYVYQQYENSDVKERIEYLRQQLKREGQNIKLDSVFNDASVLCTNLSEWMRLLG